MHGSMDVFMQHGLPRGLENELGFVGVAVKGRFHTWRQGEARYGIESPGQQLGVNGLGQTQGRHIELHEHHVAGFVRLGTGRGQAPQQHIGVLIELGARKHGIFLFGEL